MDSRMEFRGDQFRIGRKHASRWHWSEWCTYTSIAYLTVKSVTYMGVTDYFDGVIPTETVLRLSPTRTETKSEKG